MHQRCEASRAQTRVCQPHTHTLHVTLPRRLLPPGRDAGGVLRPQGGPVEHPADAHPGGPERAGLRHPGRKHLPGGGLQLEHGTSTHR